MEGYKIIELKTHDNKLSYKLNKDLNKYISKSEIIGNNYKYTEEELLYDQIGSVKDGSFIISSIEKDNEIFNIGDKITTNRLIEASNNKYYTIESFILVNKEVIIKLNDHYGTVRMMNAKKYKNNINNNVRIINPSNNNLYSIEDIEKVLFNILDSHELSEIIKEFKKYKNII